MAGKISAQVGGNDTFESYEAVANELIQRIVNLIKTHPEILNFQSAWDLFHVEGFRCADLQPTLFQAEWSLAKAKSIYNRDNKNGSES